MTQYATIREQLGLCIDELKRGALTEDRLRGIIEQLAGQAGGHQDLLYLQAQHSGIGAAVLGISLVQNGIAQELSDNSDEWPYKTIAQAVQDGWRIVQFPAAVVDDERTYGLGCEFILEKWSL